MQLSKINLIFESAKLFFTKISGQFRMEHFLLLYKNSQISYYRFGSGPRPAVCFHGYGEEASVYGFFEKYEVNEFTFYSINLPFHGKTEWKEGFTFSNDDLQQIIKEILSKDTRHLTPDTRQLTLLGFSLGGRIALSFYQSQPTTIDKLVLLAPDGLKVNFWYWLSTQTWMGNKFFAFTMKKPEWFFGFLKLMNKIGLVNASIFKFTNYYIGDKEVRQQLYNRWTTLRKITPRLSAIKSFIKENKTSVRLVYGKHDRIILSSVGEKFRNGIEEHCTISVIHSGHQVLHEKHVEEILPALR
jgi:pimeloyl-ACP methyl ester carboxylesterase